MHKLDFDAEPIHDAFVALTESEPELAARHLIRVGLGGTLFDSVRPGWARMVRLDTLAMETTDRDVVAQVFGDSKAGLMKLGEPVGVFASAAYGLTLHGHEQYFCQDPDQCKCGKTEAQVMARFAALTALWVRIVLIRLEDEREGAGRG